MIMLSKFVNNCFRAIAIVAGLTACGSGDGDGAVTTPTSISGTVASGAYVADAAVIVCPTVGTCQSATSDANGSYRVSSVMTGPYVIKASYTVSGTVETMYSVLGASGTSVNVTPITTLVAVSALPSITALFETSSGKDTGLSDATIAAAVSTIYTRFVAPIAAKSGITGLKNDVATLMSGSIIPGVSAIDRVMTQLGVSFTATTMTVAVNDNVVHSTTVGAGATADASAWVVDTVLIAASATTPDIPEPPDYDPAYFQIMIINSPETGALGHVVHLTVTANQMLLVPVKVGNDAEPKPVIENITWLTGGGKDHKDWNAPVFQTVSSTSGGTDPNTNALVDFKATYDVTLEQLPVVTAPLDSTKKYRVLKIPFRMPGDPDRSLGGSAHLTVTLDNPSTMQINGGSALTNYYRTPYAFAMPSPDLNGAGWNKRWDFMEFNTATADVGNAKTGVKRHVAFVNTTNVDFFSLGLTIRGKRASTTDETFGLALSGTSPVTDMLTALKTLPGDYAKGLLTDDADKGTYNGNFLRFTAPSLSFMMVKGPTALDNAITTGYEYYRTTPLKFTIGNADYVATTSGSGAATQLDFTAPTPRFSIGRPTTLDAIAATGPLQTGTGTAAVDDARKFFAAYLNRGVFKNTSVWKDSGKWYPTSASGSATGYDDFNSYSALLHKHFLSGATYGFSFDDVPGNGVTSDPSISDCTSMTLVITYENFPVTSK